MARIGFHSLVFEEDYTVAVRPDGTEIRFTRQERALLGQLVPHPSRLFTREQLYQSLGSRGSDRNVDFVINRLRRKLGDTDPERRFISTQYGEGYVWVAKATELAPDGVMLVIGPIRGRADGLSERVVQPLKSALEDRVARKGGVLTDPDWSAGAAAGPQFSVEVSFHQASERLHAAFVLRREPSREVLAALRESFADMPTSDAIVRIAEAMATAVWKSLALGTRAPVVPTDEPLHLRMHNASVLLDPPGATWLANGEQLARLRAADGADPTLAIMWAMHRFAQLTLVPGPEPLSRRIQTPVEDEIEELVLEHVSALRDDPLLALAAAKLLLLLNRGHEDLAETLATQAFAGSVAFAAALPMLGQVHAFRGELEEALRLYDEALQFGEPGSVFEEYILTLKAMVLIAQDDRTGVAAVFQRLGEIQPRNRDAVAILYLPPGDDGLARDLAPLADRIDLDHARRVVAYLFYRVADLFQLPAHTANLMRGPLTHLLRRFGPTVASDEIWNELPAELNYLRAPGHPATATRAARPRARVRL